MSYDQGMLFWNVNARTGVPQGSVLVPIFVSWYVLPLEDKLIALNINYHLNADDAVLYFMFDSTLSQCMFDCLSFDSMFVY